MNHNLAKLAIMSGLNLIDPYGSISSVMQPYSSKLYREPATTKPCGLTGDKWSKRKSRSKIARASKKRNRK